jgi:hypothetical protein
MDSNRTDFWQTFKIADLIDELLVDVPNDAWLAEKMSTLLNVKQIPYTS